MMKILKKAAIFLVALLLSIFLIAVYLSSGNLSDEEYTEHINYDLTSVDADSTLKVVSYNIGYLSGMINNRSIKRTEEFFDSNLEEAKTLISGLDADIIGFQEIDFGSSRSFYANQLDSLASAGMFSAGYKSINWDKKYVPFPYWPPSNHFGKMLSGQAILSRHAIKNGETIKLTPYLSAPAYYRAFYLDRLVQIAEVEYGDKRIRVMNVHLEAYDKDTRLAQIELVKRIFEEYAADQPVILVGDFNSLIPELAYEKDAIELLMEAEWITSAVPFVDEPNQKTFSSEKPEKMIDYIFYNKNHLQCKGFGVANEAGQISDHLPVWAEFELK